MNAALETACAEIRATAERRHYTRDPLAQSPTNRRLTAVIERNHRPGDLQAGWPGFSQVMTFDPPKWKRIAAEKLLYIRANREACKTMGVECRGMDARLLAQVRHCLAQAGKGTP